MTAAGELVIAANAVPPPLAGGTQARYLGRFSLDGGVADGGWLLNERVLADTNNATFLDNGFDSNGNNNLSVSPGGTLLAVGASANSDNLKAVPSVLQFSSSLELLNNSLFSVNDLRDLQIAQAAPGGSVLVAGNGGPVPFSYTGYDAGYRSATWFKLDATLQPTP